MRISVPWAGLHCVLEWFLCRAVTTGGRTQPAWGALSVARAVTSDPSLPLLCCPVHRGISPWLHGLLQGCCGVFKPQPHSFGSAVPFREAKLPCPKGRITNVKVCLELAQLSCCPWAACIVPCPPALPRAVESPWSVQLFSDAGTDEFLVLLRQDGPGTLDHLASLIMIVLFWCAVQCSGQAHMLHRPFGNWWSVFPRIRGIQTSCTCRLKSCSPPLRAHTAVSVSGSSVTHLKIYRHWDSSAHTPCSLSASSALTAMKIHIKKFGFSMLFSLYIARSSTCFPSTELSFSLLPPLQLVRFFFWFYLWLPQWKSLYFFCF